MPGDDDASSRLGATLGDGEGVVIATAIVLAVVVAFGIAPLVFEAAEFYLLVLVGVLVPLIYRQRWPVRYAPTRAVLWTVAATAVAVVLFWAGTEVADEVLDRSIDIASVGFLFAAVGIFVVQRRAVRMLDEDGPG